MLERMVTGLYFLLSSWQSFLNIGFMSAYFNCSGKMNVRIVPSKKKKLWKYFIIYFNNIRWNITLSRSLCGVWIVYFRVAFVGSELFSSTQLLWGLNCLLPRSFCGVWIVYFRAAFVGSELFTSAQLLWGLNFLVDEVDPPY